MRYLCCLLPGDPHLHPVRPGFLPSLYGWLEQHSRERQRRPQAVPCGWGPRAKPGLQQGSGGRQAVRAPPTADTGHSLVQLTQSGGHLSRPCSPPAPLTGQAQAHSQRQGMDRMAQGWGRGTGRLGGGSAEAGQRCPMEWFITIPSGRQAAAHELQAPDTSASGACKQCNMVKRKHGATEATRNTEWGTRLGPGPWRGAWSPQPCRAGQEK